MLSDSVAVAHLYNGTVLDIAKIPAALAYRDLLERLGNAPPPAPPGRLSQWQRWWNKKRGLPATANIGVLSSLLASLKSATSTTLGQPVYRVAVTRPSMPALTLEDLDDALEHAGLLGWLGDSGGSQPKHVVESQAAFAGNGHGLCTLYQDVMACWDEGAALPRRLGLFVSLTRHALYASLDTMQGAFSRWVPDGPRVLDFGAGIDSRGRFADDGDYWAHIRSRIIDVARQGKRPIDIVLLGGEDATDTMFLATLRDALASLTPESLVNVDIVKMADPTFAAARGMALYARRRQEVPGRCVERPNCDEEREEQRIGGAEGKVEL